MYAIKTDFNFESFLRFIQLSIKMNYFKKDCMTNGHTTVNLDSQ